MMADATDIANFFISVSEDSDDPMTNTRLNILLYFSLGWGFRRFGTPMFTEPMEARAAGPVFPRIYDMLSPYGKDPVRKTAGKYSPDVFTEEQIDLLIDVFMKYRDRSVFKLIELSRDEPPWKDVFSGKNVQMPAEAVKKYFLQRKDDIAGVDMTELINKLDRAGYRNSDGVLVLPKEFDD